MTEGLTIERADGVLRIALDRPDVLNALSAEMADRIAEEIEQAPAHD
jgi:enoyl-CoA hydratase/carnithine racemase